MRARGRALGDGVAMNWKQGLVLAVGLVALLGVAGAEDAPSSTLSFMVVKDYNGKPVRNAAVVLHPVNSHGKQAARGIRT